MTRASSPTAAGTASARILVVDDDPDTADLVKAILVGEGYQVTTAGSVAEALAAARAQGLDCVVSDVRMPGDDGFSLLDELRRDRPDLPVILLTAFTRLEEAVRAVGRGAERYLPKPVPAAELREAVRNALDRSAAARRSQPAPGGPGPWTDGVVGRSPALVALYGLVARAAASDAPVLIRGETGVGKEWVARAIHRYSARSHAPFVPVNCSALPEGTLESELFGHLRGGFTGAVAPRKGLFQAAHGGVLFLDEVGDLPARVQAELLRVVQEGELRPVGSDETSKIDVRIVCATHRDLGRLVAEGRFREDLLFRLRVVDFVVPPLRERREDIPELAAYFLAQAGVDRRCAPETLVELARREWPGNVRELASAVKRAAALAPGPVVLPSDLPPDHPEEPPAVRGGASALPSLPALWQDYLAQHPVPPLDELEQDFVLAVVRHLGGNKTLAAEVLRVDRKTIRRILARGRDDEE